MSQTLPSSTETFVAPKASEDYPEGTAERRTMLQQQEERTVSAAAAVMMMTKAAPLAPVEVMEEEIQKEQQPVRQ